MTGLFIGFLVEKCAACQLSEVRFFFQKWAYSLNLAWFVEEGWKVSSDSGLTWWLSGAVSRLVNLSNYFIWCFFFWLHDVKRSLCAFGRFETMIWPIVSSLYAYMTQELLSILVFVNKNCCLCKGFTELYFFYWLFVVSFEVLSAVPVAFSRTWTPLVGVLKNCVYQTFLRIPHNKTINKK